MNNPEPAIYELLKNLVPGNQVYAMQAPQNVSGNFIVFQRTSSERWRAINGPDGIGQALIQIDVYGAGYYDVKALAAQVESILDGYRGTVQHGTNSPRDSVTIAGISLQSDADLLDQTDTPQLYRNTASYLVTYEQH